MDHEFVPYYNGSVLIKKSCDKIQKIINSHKWTLIIYNMYYCEIYGLIGVKYLDIFRIRLHELYTCDELLMIKPNE